MKSEAALKAAFDGLKSDFREGRFPFIGGRLCGESTRFGQALLDLFHKGGRTELDAADVLARFWVLRYRGLPEPADLAGADGGAAFVMAFTAFPYLDLLMESWELGAVVEEGADRLTVACLFDGLDEGTRLVAEKGPMGWRFDLMPLFAAKAALFDRFITVEFGDFDTFLDHYVAEHDLDFNAEQAWHPPRGA